MSVNKVFLIGRLGQDPESTQTSGDTLVVKFSVATDRMGKSNETDWHRIVTFGKTAEACSKYLQKGSLVYVEGRIQYSAYEKDGMKRYFTDIIANRVEFLSSKTPASEAQWDQGASASMDDDIPF